MEGGGLYKRGGEYFKMEGTHLELACWSLPSALVLFLPAPSEAQTIGGR